MRFGFVRFGLWRAALGMVALLGFALSGAYIRRIATGRGFGWMGVLGVVLVAFLLGISLVVAYLFWVLGAAFAEVKEEGVRVRMGRLLDFGIPWGSILRVGRGQYGFREGVGVRYDFNGGLAVVSASHGIVELELREPLAVRLPFGGASLPAERVRLSLREPVRFLAEVEKRLSAQGGVP